jgi:hypothetical protein
MMDPHFPWLAVLGAALITVGALIVVARGDRRGVPWFALIGAALIAAIALVGMAHAEPLPVPPGCG